MTDQVFSVPDLAPWWVMAVLALGLGLMALIVVWRSRAPRSTRRRR